MYRRTGNLRFLCAHVLKRSLFEISRLAKIISFFPQGKMAKHVQKHNIAKWYYNGQPIRIGLLK